MVMSITMNPTLAMMRKRRIPLCCCPSCLAHFPKRAKDFKADKAMLKRIPEFRAQTKGQKEEAS
jgi:hypothetical protein